MSDETRVSLDITGRRASLTFERADGVNVMGAGTVKQLSEHLATLSADRNVDVVVLRSASEKTFLMGADVRQLEDISPVAAVAFAQDFQDMCDHLESLPQLTVAAVSGPTFGGGCEITLACDVRIASARMRMALPELSLGLMPGGGGTARLARLAGTSVALELILSAGALDAQRALRVGVVNRVHEAAELAGAIDEFTSSVLAHTGAAIRLTKSVLRQSVESSLAGANELERLAFGVLSATPEAQEGVSAFIERRQPRWSIKDEG